MRSGRAMLRVRSGGYFISWRIQTIIRIVRLSLGLGLRLISWRIRYIWGINLMILITLGSGSRSWGFGVRMRMKILKEMKVCRNKGRRLNRLIWLIRVRSFSRRSRILSMMSRGLISCTMNSWRMVILILIFDVSSERICRTPFVQTWWKVQPSKWFKPQLTWLVVYPRIWTKSTQKYTAMAFPRNTWTPMPLVRTLTT